MKHDIFISYSRKDFDEVNRFVGMLKERIPSLTCWFDITGIESGDEFENKIITALDNSTYVLFALSDHSIQSQWTKDEVMYAKNTEKRVIPLVLKGAQLKDWFLFKFGRIDCIDTTNSLQVEKLVKNLSDWTGKAMVTASGLKTKTTPSEPNIQFKKEEVKKELHEASLPNEHEDYSARKEMGTIPTESEPKWYSSSSLWRKWAWSVSACLLVFVLGGIFWPESGEGNPNEISPIATPEMECEDLHLLKSSLNDVHTSVDLGLSVKWATCNVGATKPEEYGNYYAWGETEPKDDYSWKTYQWCKGNYKTITKYCTDSSFGIVDNKTVLLPVDDVAYVEWGGNWRLPTNEEFKELLSSCTWLYTTYNNVVGYLVIGPNENSIFLPATGQYGDTELKDCGLDGYYWSATSYEGDCDLASYFFCGARKHIGGCSRFVGHTIRPVCD